MHTMTDDQVNDRVKVLPVITEIKQEVQETKEEFNIRFDKGTRRMDSIEDEMRQGFKDMKADREKKHAQIMDKLDQDKENRLLKKLEERDIENASLKKREEERREKRDKRIWEVVKGGLYIVVVLIAASYGLKLPF